MKFHIYLFALLTILPSYADECLDRMVREATTEVRPPAAAAQSALNAAQTASVKNIQDRIGAIQFDEVRWDRPNNLTNASSAERLEDFFPTDPKLRDGIKESWEAFYDKEGVSKYMGTLMADCFQYMKASGKPAWVKLADEGKIDQEAMIEFITKKHTDRGFPPGTIPENAGVLEFEEFRRFLSSGPVIDRAFPPGNGHGVFPHMLQLDYILPIIQKNIGPGRSVKEFFDYVGTDQGLKLWNEMFDLFYDTKSWRDTTFITNNFSSLVNLY